MRGADRPRDPRPNARLASMTPTTAAASTDAQPSPPRLRPAQTGRQLLAEWERPAALLLAVIVFSLVQSVTPNIIGIDGQYHIKLASLLREAGSPRIDFLWLRFTLLNEAGYTDHHLLLHLLQAPFTVLDLRIAAKFSSVVFAALGVWSGYLLLARFGARWPLLWLVLLLAVSHTFLWRHSMARAQSLALLAIIATLWLLFERRERWLLPLGFASAWLFNGFVLPFVAPLAWLATGLLVERRLHWRPLVYLALGTALGLLIHPYFPRNVVFAALHLLPKVGLGLESNVGVGAEWYPYSPSRFVTRVGPALTVLLIGALPTLARLRRRQPLEPRALTLLLVALFFLAMVARSQRMIEYFPAFAVLAAGLGWATVGRKSDEPRELPVGQPAEPPAEASFSRLTRLAAGLTRARPWLAGLTVLLVAGWLAWTVGQARRDALGASPNAQLESYRGAATWLVANSEPGSLVFNVDWDDFPQLFFWNTHNVYVAGLDPTYLSLYDPELYRLFRAIGSGEVERPSVPLRERFGAQHVFSDTRHGRFLERAVADPDLEEVYRSPRAVVFRVRPPT